MLKIRLQRTGRKHEPSFRLVLTDSKNSTQSGRYLEVLGSHDFRKTTTNIETDRVKYWMSQGAKPTPTVHNLLIAEKVIDGKKVNVLPKKTVPKAEEPTAPVEPSKEESAAPEAPAAPVASENVPAEEPAVQPATNPEAAPTDPA